MGGPVYGKMTETREYGRIMENWRLWEDYGKLEKWENDGTTVENIGRRWKTRGTVIR